MKYIEQSSHDLPDMIHFINPPHTKQSELHDLHVKDEKKKKKVSVSVNIPASHPKSFSVIPT